MIELKQSDNLFADSKEEKSSLQEFSFPAANNIVSKAEKSMRHKGGRYT